MNPRLLAGTVMWSWASVWNLHLQYMYLHGTCTCTVVVQCTSWQISVLACKADTFIPTSHNLLIYLSAAALLLHSFLCNSPDELRTNKLSWIKNLDKIGMNVSALRARILNWPTTTRLTKWFCTVQCTYTVQCQVACIHATTCADTHGHLLHAHAGHDCTCMQLTCLQGWGF